MGPFGCGGIRRAAPRMGSRLYVVRCRRRGEGAAMENKGGGVCCCRVGVMKEMKICYWLGIRFRR